MKRISLFLLLLAIFATAVPLIGSTGAAPVRTYPDVDEEHWSYQAIMYLTENGYLEGFPDARFKGEGPATRYHLAEMLSKMVERVSAGFEVPEYDFEVFKSLIEEFSDQFPLLGIKIVALEKEMTLLKTEVAAERARRQGPEFPRLTHSGEIAFHLRHLRHAADTMGDDWSNYATLGLGAFAEIEENVTAFARLLADKVALEDIGATDTTIDELYVDMDHFFGLGNLRIGRQWLSVGHSLVLDDKMDGFKFSRNFMEQISFTLFGAMTRNAAGGVNSQWDGAGRGTSRFYMYSDERRFLKGAGQADFKGLNTGAGLDLASGALDPLDPFVAGGAAGHRITLYGTPSAFPMPQDDYSGTYLGALPDNTWNHHTGIGLIGGYDDDGDGIADSLAPVSVPVFGTVGRNFRAFDYTAPRNITDVTGTDTQPPAGLERDWQVQPAAGLDTWGASVAVDFGGHAIAGYFLQRRFDRYDPFTVLGDPWAAMVDYNSDLVADIDSDGNDLSPTADPTYWGITLDGEVFANLNYFFEFVRFDPDIVNIGVDPTTADASNSAGTGWKGNNMDSGDAWVAGLEWNLTEDMNLLVQYGAGDEEFIPASIYETESLNGMYGRMNDSSLGGPVGGELYGTGSLTGVRDFLIRLTADFNDKTTGALCYELVRDNDSSAARLVAGDPSVTGHPVQDYRMWTVAFRHIYKPNTVLKLRYDNLAYEDDKLQNARVETARAFNTDDKNHGGWQRLQTTLEVRY